MNEKELFEMMNSLRGDLKSRGEYFFPTSLAEFIADLVAVYPTQTLLDPWARTTLLANTVSAKAGVNQCTALILEQQLASKAQEYAEKCISVLNVDGLSWMNESSTKYDAIVCSTPFGMRNKKKVKAIDGSELGGDYAHLLLHESCKRLNSGGIAAFVTTLNFQSQSNAIKLRASIEGMGVGYKACISLPPTTFYPYTNIPAILVIFEEGYNGPLFVAKYSEDKKHQQVVLDNLAKNKEASVLSQGRFVDAVTFHNLESIELSEKLEKMHQRMGLTQIIFGSIIEKVGRPKGGEAFRRLEELPNSIYLPLMANTKATISQSDLPEKLKSYIQLVIDPDKANAGFVMGLLNSPLGQSIRDMAKSGVAIPRIGVDDLMAGPFYLPALDQQVAVSAILSNIERLRCELNELEQQLWSKPQAVNNISKSLSKVNKEDRFEDWVETLPFPLASIIWRYHGNKVKNSERESCETLMHFFEALGEFVATIHISALTSNEEVKKKWMPKIKTVLDDQGLSIAMATFGTWKCLLEFLSSRLRKEMQKNAELYLELYRVKDREILEMLLSKRLVGVLQKTNKIRNSFAHGGAVNASTAQSSLMELQSALDEVRICFGETWVDYELIDPRESKYKAGITHYKVRKIVGTRNSPFRTDEVFLTEQMEDGQLHLHSPGENRALPLLPFIKVMHSPKTEENACYFYNRRQGDDIRYLSYHFATENEVVDIFEDANDAINLISNSEV